MVFDPGRPKRVLTIINNSTRLVDEGFALLVGQTLTSRVWLVRLILYEISRVNESTNPEGWIHNGLLREMIQFDDHIFEMGWFNHQLGGVMGLHPQGVHRLIVPSWLQNGSKFFSPPAPKTSS